MLAFLALHAAPAAYAQLVQIPGTGIAIDQPPGFAVSSNFVGLENARTGSNITVAEFPAERYAEVAAIFESLDTAQRTFAQQGVRVESVRQVRLGDQGIPFIVGSQAIGDRTLTKFISLLRGDTAVVLTFNLFDDAELTEAGAVSVLRSAQWTSEPTLEMLAGLLPFTVEPEPPFRIVDVIGTTTMLLTTFEGEDATGLAPTMTVSRSPSDLGERDPAELGPELLRTTIGFRDARIDEQATVEFGGGAAHYLVAVAGERTAIQYLRIPEDGLYLRLVALGESAAISELKPTITTIAESARLIQR